MEADHELLDPEIRLNKRIFAMMVAFSGDDYTYLSCCMPSNMIPQSPDPNSISKRHWESLMQKWRYELSALRFFFQDGQVGPWNAHDEYIVGDPSS